MAIYDDMSSQEMLDQLLGNQRVTGDTYAPPAGTAMSDLKSLIDASGLPPTHPIVVAAQRAGYGNPVGLTDLMIAAGGAGTRQCPPGMVYDPEIRDCVPEEATWRDCGEGYERDPITKECVKIATPPTEPPPCPEGYERNEAGECVPTMSKRPKDPCPQEGYVRNEAGECVPGPTTPPPPPTECPPGYALNAEGKCVLKEPPPPPPPPPPPKDECPPGLVKDPVSGLCVPPKPPTPPPPTVTCQDGFIYDPAQKKCVPIAKPPTPPTPPPGPQPCPAGYERKTPTGPCEPIDLGPCPSGYVRSTVTGKCEPITLPPTPPTPPTPPGPVTPTTGVIRPLPRLTGSAYFGPSVGAAAQTPTVINPATATGGPTGTSATTPRAPSGPTPYTPATTPSTPRYFGPTTGILPGTLPSSYNPLSAYRGPLPTDLLRQNPNLSPTILGGPERLGYYVDRLGNKIYSPGGNFGFAEGGEVDSEEAPDPASAQAALRKLLEAAPAQTQTEVQMSPNARSVKRTSTKSVDQGNMKGMSMKMEEAKVASGESARDQLAALGEEYKQRLREMDNEAKGLLRNTLARGTFDRPGLAGRGPLTRKRFEKGGEAVKSEPTGELGLMGGLKQQLLESDLFKSMTPLQVRTYLQSVEGLPEMRTMPITEKDLDQEELDKLRDVIKFQEQLVKDPANYGVGKGGKRVYKYAEPNAVNYDVLELYRQAKQGKKLGQASEGLDPNVRDQSGGFPWYEGDKSIMPSANIRNTLGQFIFKHLPDGSTVIKDKYDFTKDVALDSNPLVKYADELGVNRPVKITLPPVKGKK